MGKKKFLLKWYDIRKQNHCYGTSMRKRDSQNLQEHPKRPLLVANKHSENQSVFNFSKPSFPKKWKDLIL